MMLPPFQRILEAAVRTLALSAVIVLASANLGHAQQGAPNASWPTYGGDAGSSKYAPLDQIDGDNVDQLEVAWQWTSPDGPIISGTDLGAGAFKATPIMVDGVLYIRTSLSIVSAIAILLSCSRKVLTWTFVISRSPDSFETS